MLTYNVYIIVYTCLYIFIYFVFISSLKQRTISSFLQSDKYAHTCFIHIQSLTLLLYSPCVCCHSFCVTVCGLFEWKRICAGFFLSFICIYIHCICTVVGDPIIKREEGRRGRDRMVVGFTTTYAIGAYHHWCCKFESRSRRGVQHYEMKFFSDLRHVGGFLQVFRFPPPIKLTATI